MTVRGGMSAVALRRTRTCSCFHPYAAMEATVEGAFSTSSFLPFFAAGPSFLPPPWLPPLLPVLLPAALPALLPTLSSFVGAAPFVLAPASSSGGSMLPESHPPPFSLSARTFAGGSKRFLSMSFVLISSASA